MAIYHLSTKPISRSSGRSAVASVAYRAGIEIKDERLGKTYDYTKRNGVLGEVLLLPNHLRIDRAELWNMAEKAENRKDARTAREIVINIPHELITDDNHKLATRTLGEFAHHLTERYGVAVDIAYHAPDQQGDNRNYHAHLLLTTRKIEVDNNGVITLGEKSELELSDKKLKELGKPRAKEELVNLRQAWADIANRNLEQAGIAERIDHRSHADRGLLTLPTVKMGWQATELERKGIRTDVGDHNRAIKAYNAQIELRNGLKSQIKTSDLDKIDPKSPSQPKNVENNNVGEPTSPTKIENGVTLPSTPKNTPKSQNNANSNLLSSEQYRRIMEFLSKFNERVEKIAQDVLKNQLKALQAKAKPILAKFEELRDNEPLFFGKEQWRNDKQQALNAYNAIKQQHDTMKANGITDEHRKQAEEQLAKDDPNYIEKAKQADRFIELHQQAKLDSLAQQYGADIHTRAGETYHGKIIHSDSKITLQETKDGIVLHGIGGLQVGKGYTIFNEDGKNYTVQKDYEIRVNRKEYSHDKSR